MKELSKNVKPEDHITLKMMRQKNFINNEVTPSTRFVKGKKYTFPNIGRDGRILSWSPQKWTFDGMCKGDDVTHYLFRDDGGCRHSYTNIELFLLRM